MSTELPSSWTTVRLEQLLAPLDDGRTLHHGWSPQCEKEPARSDDEWGVLKTTAIQAGSFLPEHNKRLPSSLEPRPQHEVKAGDLLITCAGPRVRCGVPCLVRKTRPRLMLSGKMYRFRTSPDLCEPGYLEKYLLSHAAQQAIDAMKTGGSDSGLNLTHDRFKPLPVPLAPMSEQQRIVSRIEELFSEIDEGERALERVVRLVERYRQSVLKAAVTGELTFGWRDPRASGARVEARDDQFGELPPGWDWMPLGELIESGPQNGVYLHQSAYGEGSPIVRIDDFQPGWLRPASELRRVRADAETVGRYSLQEADIVVNRVNSPSHLGKCFLASREHAGALFESNMMRFRVRDRLLPAYLELYLRSEVGRRRLTANCKHAVNQASINQKDVAATPVPLPPVAEQLEIVDRVDRAFSDIAATEATITVSAAGTSALRQSILKAAFSGQLVPQDPRDEPASALLARLAAQPVPAALGRGVKPRRKPAPAGR